MCCKHLKISFFNYVKSVSLKIEPLQYIAIYYNGSIFNETDFSQRLLFHIHTILRGNENRALKKSNHKFSRYENLLGNDYLTPQYFCKFEIYICKWRVGVGTIISKCTILFILTWFIVSWTSSSSRTISSDEYPNVGNSCVRINIICF